jgi:N-glycosylase/DNA lyase
MVESILKNPSIEKIVNLRLKEFESNKKWFSELCFCILTANSKAQTAINIQNEIGTRGFLNLSQKDLSSVIKKNKHRFHNNKAKYIIEARKFSNIKEILKNLDEFEAREWLVKNIKGIGYKESSHFLRNIGYKNLAILDRHILNFMKENNYIEEIPKPLNKNNYLDIENKFNLIARNLKMDSAELDLYMWHIKTGNVLK